VVLVYTVTLDAVTADMVVGTAEAPEHRLITLSLVRGSVALAH